VKLVKFIIGNLFVIGSPFKYKKIIFCFFQLLKVLKLFLLMF